MSEVAWTIVSPLVGGACLLVCGRALARWVAAFATLGSLLAALAVARTVQVGGTVHHRVGGWGAPLGIELRADGIAALVLLMVAVVGTLITLQVFSREGDTQGFFSLWFLAWGALNALVLSADIFNLYVALELMTLSAVGLVAITGDQEAVRAALRYLLLALSGSLVYLLGVAILYGAYASLDLTILKARLIPDGSTGVALALMTGGLCLKTALFPLHGWLPPAHAHAPPYVSALLAGLIIKGSFYVLFRLWTGLMPAELMPRAGELLGLLGTASIVWGSLLALGQSRLKPLIAYSTVAQLGYLFLAFPLSTRSGWYGAIFLMVSHAAAKASLFLAAGTIHRALGRDDLQGMKGLARHLPVTYFSLGLAGVSLMGLPPSGGFVAKWLLVRTALEGGRWWLAMVMLLGGLLAAGYVFKFLRGAFLPSSREVPLAAPSLWTELIPLSLALLALVLGFLPDAPLKLLQVGMER